MITDIKKNILNYLNYLQDKEDNSIVKPSLQIAIELCNSGSTQI